jgi:hypothetical protein
MHRTHYPDFHLDQTTEVLWFQLTGWQVGHLFGPPSSLTKK